MPVTKRDLACCGLFLVMFSVPVTTQLFWVQMVRRSTLSTMPWIWVWRRDGCASTNSSGRQRVHAAMVPLGHRRPSSGYKSHAARHCSAVALSLALAGCATTYALNPALQRVRGSPQVSAKQPGAG